MVNFENLFGKVSPAVRDELKRFWKDEGALPDNQDVESRLNQVVYVIREGSTSGIVGVSTSEKKRVTALNNHYFYEFRCFIGEKNRVAGLDVKLSKLTFSFLEEISRGDADKPIGIFSVLENESLKKHPMWRRAVWPEIEMYFVGYTQSGHPIRVHYFKNARI